MAYDGELRFGTSMDTSGFQKDANALSNLVKGLGVFEVIKKGMEIVGNSIGAAVSRYDTLNKFPALMEKMGYSADEAAASQQKLSDGIQGLPTTLDGIVSSTKQLAIATGSLDKGTDSALALNNAFLASGASAGEAERGMVQYIQMLSSGKVDMQSWRTLNETMTYALQKTAESFGFAGASAKQDFYDALKDGKITFTQFNDRLIELNNGVGGFAEVAKTSTGGIGTAWTNLQTAIVRGTTGIVSAIDKGLSTTRLQSIENVIVMMKDKIVAALELVAQGFGFAAENIEPITIGLISLAVAVNAVKFLALVEAMGGVSGALSEMLPKVIALTVAKAKDAAVMGGLYASYLKDAIVKGATTIKTIAETIAIKANTAATNGGIAAKLAAAVASKVVAAATWLWNAALAANPVFLVVAGVAALAAGIFALVSAFSKNKTAHDKEVEALKKTTKAQTEYNKSLDENIEKVRASSNDGVAKVKANSELVKSLEKLIAKNDESGKQNLAIASTVDQLNSSMGDLGLSYDAATGKLNMTQEELSAYISNLAKVTEHQQAQEEYNRLLQEQVSVQEQINAASSRVHQGWADWQAGLITGDEYLALKKEEDALINELTITYRGYKDATQDAKETAESSYDAQAEAAVRAVQIRNNEMDSVREYAEQYGISADDIISSASEMSGGLDEWARNQAKLLTESGMDIDMLAEKWGVSAEEIQKYMDETGGSLDDYNDKMKKSHTKEGLSLDDLAEKWNTTTDQIKRDMSIQEISMQEWSDNQQKEFDAAEKEILDYAKKFNLSAEQVRLGIAAMGGDAAVWAAEQEQTLRAASVAEDAYVAKIKSGQVEINAAYAQGLEARRMNGEELNKIEQAYLDQWNSINQEAADVYKTQQQDIVDASEKGASRIKLSKQQSAKEVLAIQKANNEVTAKFVENYNTMYAKIPESQRQYLAEMSVDDARFLDDMVKKWDKGGKEQWEQYVSGLEEGKTIAAERAKASAEEVAQAGVEGFESQEPAIKGAGAGTVGTYDEGAKEAAGTSEAGQAIANAVIEDLTNADYSGITAAIATAITSGTTDVVSAAETMAEGVLSEAENMRSGAETAATSMMSDVNSCIVRSTATVKSSSKSMADGVVTEFMSMQTRAAAVATGTMTGINSAIITSTATIKTSASTLVSGVVTNLEKMVSGGKAAATNMMAGMLQAMKDNAQTLYNKAQEIADKIAATLKAAWDEHSPSRVSYGIMEFFMIAMYNAMNDMKGMLFDEADFIADEITNRLAISPDVTASMTSRMQSIIDRNPLNFGGLTPVGAASGSGGSGVTYVTNLYQTITSPTPLSASELTQEAEDFLRRAKWQLP